MFGNQHAVAVGDDFVRFSEHDLDHARVLVEGGGQLDRPRRRLHLREPHVAPLRLGNDLLGHDDDVEVDRDDAGGVDRVTDEARDVVSLADDGDARERRQGEGAGGRVQEEVLEVDWASDRGSCTERMNGTMVRVQVRQRPGSNRWRTSSGG